MGILLLLAVILVVPTRVGAQGFGIYELSACAMARGAAGVAQPCDDGSAVAVNPAAIAGHEGITFGSGGALAASPRTTRREQRSSAPLRWCRTATSPMA
jgi:long-subunit fatty acid transport protein